MGWGVLRENNENETETGVKCNCPQAPTANENLALIRWSGSTGERIGRVHPPQRMPCRRGSWHRSTLEAQAHWLPGWVWGAGSMARAGCNFILRALGLWLLPSKFQMSQLKA